MCVCEVEVNDEICIIDEMIWNKLEFTPIIICFPSFFLSNLECYISFA